MKIFILLFFTVTLLFSEYDYGVVKSGYFKSYDYEQMGNYSEAIKVLAPLYSAYPKGYTLNLRFGWLFFLNKNYSDAITYYKKASLLKPQAIDPRLGLIRTYLATASYKKAESIAYEVLKMDYYNYYANYYVVQALTAQKKYEAAQKMLFKMLALYPTDILFLEQLARVYTLTDSAYSQQLYEDILILDPNNVFVNSRIKR